MIIVILPAYGDEVWLEPERDILEVHVGTLEYDKIPEDFECNVTPQINYNFVARQIPVSYPDYDSLILRIGGQDTTKDLQMEISLWKDDKTSANDLSYDISLRTENGTKKGGALYSPDSASKYSTLGVAIESNSDTINGVLPSDAQNRLAEIFGDGTFTSYGIPTSGSYKVYVRVFDSDDNTDWITSDRCGIQAIIPVDISQEEGTQIGTIEFSEIKVSVLDTSQENLEEIQQIIEDVAQKNNVTTISLDRDVYPVPFGGINDFENTVSIHPDGRSLFPVHLTAVVAGKIEETETLGTGDLTLHIRINDPNFDVSEDIDEIAQDLDSKTVGPLKISISRGFQTMVLAYAGGSTPNENGLIDVDDDNPDDARQLGPIFEVAPDTGIFELDFVVRYTDGPASSKCPATAVFTSLNDDAASGSEESRFDLPSAEKENYCIMKGDVLWVEYTSIDSSGNVNTLTDTASFDLRNGLLESDKQAYIIGSDMILTLTEPDLDLDNDAAETYTLDLIEWDSYTATLTMGELGSEKPAFDPEPSEFRETGESTGIFQTVITIPKSLEDKNLERGEEIVLEYTDWGPSEADYVGREDEDINLTIFSSNFGANVELDKKEYSWVDKVYIKIVSPNHNLDADLVDEIGNTKQYPVKIYTRSFELDNYRLVETGTNTGIFTGEVALTRITDDVNINATGSGPTDGLLPSSNDDQIIVSFDFSEDETVVGSAIIQVDKEQMEIPPLKQIELGIKPDDVQCNSGMELLLKHSGEPVCVKPETKQKLIQRGW